jgi:hypothetical protein
VRHEVAEPLQVMQLLLQGRQLDPERKVPLRQLEQLLGSDALQARQPGGQGIQRALLALNVQPVLQPVQTWVEQSEHPGMHRTMDPLTTYPLMAWLLPLFNRACISSSSMSLTIT